MAMESRTKVYNKPEDVPGFRFLPSDEELVRDYLYNKIARQPFPQGVVVDCDLYGKENPWQIWEQHGERVVKSREGDEDLYFFTRLKRQNPKAKRIERRIGLGTWCGEDRGCDVITNFPNEECILVGSKKRFRFEKSGSHQDGAWIMHEYSIQDSFLDPHFKSMVNPIVLCRLRKNKNRKEYTTIVDDMARRTHAS